MPSTLVCATLGTSMGPFQLVANDDGLFYVRLPNVLDEHFERYADHHYPEGWTTVKDDQYMSPYVLQFREYFAGRRKHFDIPFAYHGTEFQKTVWNALLEIPYGETISYSQLASLIARPTAIRAVGTANGSNPLPILIPCHRVVSQGGGLGGYGGGLELKRYLLNIESS